MLEKTKGIVVNTTNYAEASIIAKIYTEKFGMQSFLMNGVRQAKPRFNKNLLQPLTTIELIAYYKPHLSLHRVKELNASPVLASIPFNTVKTAIAIFLAEVLSRSIKEEEPNNDLFHFLLNTILMFDIEERDSNNFHLWFMIQLTRYLGFYPGNKYTTDDYLDLEEGRYSSDQPLPIHFLERTLTEKFFRISQTTIEDLNSIIISSAERKKILHALITYYELHQTQGVHLKSYKVLEEIMG